MIIKHIIIFLLCLTCLSFYSQRNLPSPSKNAVNDRGIDTSELSRLLKLGKYYSKTNLDSADLIFQKGLELSQSGGNVKFIMSFYLNLGNTNKSKTEYIKAIDNLKKGLEMAEKVHDSITIAKTYNALGQVYARVSDYNRAVEFYLKNIDIYDKLGKHELKRNAYSNLGNVYYKMRDLRQAIRYQMQSGKMAEETNDNEGVAISLHNIAEYYYLLQMKDSSLYFAQRTRRVVEKRDDLAAKASVYSLLSKIYDGMKMTDSSLYMVDRAIEIAIKMKDPSNVAKYKDVKAQILNRIGRHEEAAEICESAIGLMENADNSQVKVQTYYTLYTAYKKLNNIPKSLKALETYLLLNDSLTKFTNKNNVSELAMKYEYHEKRVSDSLKTSNEKNILNLQLEKEKQNRYAMLGITGIGLLFSMIVFNRYRITRKQKMIIEAKEEETQRQKLQLELKQKEIIDSIHYAKRIQQAHIPNEKRVQNNISRLKG